MRTPAETRAHYPAGPGTVYDLMFCDGIKVCENVGRVSFVADSDDDAIAQAQDAMRDRPRHEVGDLSRAVKRGHLVMVAAFAAQGARVESDDMFAVWDLHREFHGCGTGGAQ